MKIMDLLESFVKALVATLLAVGIAALLIWLTAGWWSG